MKTLWRLILPVLLISTPSGADHPRPAVKSDQALEELLQGNKRFVSGKMKRPHQTAARRVALSKGQSPFAIILCCADSRVPPEILFDQGLGDLFVIRVAGNILDDANLASIEYAAEHLGVGLMMVLGHEKCGAVSATVNGGKLPGHLGSLVQAIKPAVDECRGKAGDLLDNTVVANVKRVVSQVKLSKPILNKLVAEKKLRVVGGRYDLDTGAVTLVE